MKKSEEKPRYGLLIALALLVVLVWGSTPYVLSMFTGDFGSQGQFGDQFGAVNALFSGLAFAGFFFTVFLQQRQLVLQRTELELQRIELREQREEMIASRGELAKQVAMQRIQARISVAQIAVASINAKIEAEKLAAQEKIRMGIQGIEVQVKGIEVYSTALAGLSDKLEGEIPSVG